MILKIHNDASYLGTSIMKYQAAGHFFLRCLPPDKRPIKLSGPICIIAYLLHLVAASTAEAELGAFSVKANKEKLFIYVLQKCDASTSHTSTL